jgi:hypothetical protein
VDADDLTSIDLLEEFRTALDGLEPLLRGRMIDIEMPRLRVQADPTAFRRIFAEVIGYAVARSQPPDSITVRVARTGKAARIEVVNEGGHVAGDEFPDFALAAEELRAMGAEIGSGGPVGDVFCWMTLALAAGGSSAADA